jgi:MFS family permease
VTPGVSGLLSPVFGRLADRFGRKMMLIRSLIGFVIIVAAMGLVTSVLQLFLLRLLMGFFAGFTPMAMALATVSAPRDKVPAAIGMVQSAQLLSVAIGPAIGGYVASHFGMRYAFFATAGLCAVALLGLIILFQEVAAPTPGTPRATTTRMPLRRILLYPHFPAVVALLFIAQFPGSRPVAPDSASGIAHAGPREGRGHLGHHRLDRRHRGDRLRQHRGAPGPRDPVRPAPPDRLAGRWAALRGDGPESRLVTLWCCARSPGSVSAPRSR